MGGHIPFMAPSGPDALGGIGSFTDLPGAPNPFIYTNATEFRKAVTAGYGTDVAALVGGGALRLQSLEQTLLRSIQTDLDFKLFNKLAQSSATATVDEFTVKESIGGFFGSGFNDELGVIAETQGTYERRVGLVRFLMTRRQVSVVQESQKTLVDTIAEEKVDATVELKTTIEWASFYGDSTVMPLEFDGLIKQIGDAGDSELILDAAGGGLGTYGEEIINLAEIVASHGRRGKVTDFFCSPAVQSSELDQKLDPAFRVASTQEGATKIGTPVTAIRTSFGDINSIYDTFIQEGQAPWEGRGGNFPALVTAAGLTAPVIASAVAAPNAASKFTAAHAGDYYWGAESVGKAGRSALALSAQTTVAAGDGVTVTITNPADALVTGFVVHRSRKDGTNAAADLRDMTRIARAGGASTVFVDVNEWIPGTSVGFALSMTPGDNAINLRRLLPMTMFPLYPTNTATRPWAQLFFCYLRLGKRRRHGFIKNILPKRAQWRPFN